MRKLGMGRVLCVALIALVGAGIVGCATGTGKKTTAKAPEKKAPQKKASEKKTASKKAPEKKTPEKKAPITEKFPAVTLSLPKPTTLAEAVDQLAEDVGGCLVVMAGLDNRKVPAQEFNATPFDAVAAAFASATGCSVQQCPNYAFIYPAAQGYEGLLTLSLAGKLDPAFEKLSVAVTFGFDTPLYEVFYALSHILRVTIVADNVVAAAKTGTLTLAEIPLQDCLEAVLKSARVSSEGLKTESTPEYIFFATKENPVGPGVLLDADKLTPEQNALLDKKVTVIMPAAPKDPAHLEIPPGAVNLGSVVETLSAQLGIKVTFDEGLDDLPVNPCELNQIRARTAMQLLIRQWPLAKYGYALTADGIRIKLTH